MTYLLGTARGLDVCSSERGTFTILALDHRQNLRRELQPRDPDSVTVDAMVEFKRTVVRALAPIATAILLDPELGAAQAIVDRSLPGSVGLVVALEATGYDGPPNRRTSRVLDGWSVDQAKRIGASAVKFLVYYHPDAANARAQEQLVAEVHAACRSADLPLFLEPITYSPDSGSPLVGEARRQAVIETARRLSEVGGDILKVEFPYDAAQTDRRRWGEACRAIDAASAIPWVLLSGGVGDDLFAAQLETGCRAGASGAAVGRSVWAPAASLSPAERVSYLHADGAARLQRFRAIVDEHAVPWFERRTAAMREMNLPQGWFRSHA